jgi:probable HAF family extracellular repeat protein
MRTLKVVCLLLALSVAGVEPAFSQTNKPGQPLTARNLISLLKGSGTASGSAATSEGVVKGLARTKIYQFASADYPGAPYSMIFDRNVSTAVGTFEFSGLAQGLTLKGQTYAILTVPGSIACLIGGINTSGEMVGGYGDLSNSVHAFIDNAGVFTTFDFPGGSTTIALEINDAGEIVGQYLDAANNQHGFLNNGGTFTQIDFPGTTAGTSASGINSSGEIVGYWEDSTNVQHGFLLNNGIFTSIDFPLAKSTEAWGINDDGEISGSFVDTNSITHGFIFTGSAWGEVDVPGASGTQLTQIKNNHNVVGAYSDSLNETHGLTGH